MLLQSTYYHHFVEKVFAGEHFFPKVKDIRSRLLSYHPEILKRSHGSISFWYLLEWMFRLCITSVLILVSLQYAWWPLLMAGVVLQGFNLLGAVSLIHDMAHNSFFSNKKINSTLGVLIAPLILGRFYSFRQSHLRHHKFNQSSWDPKVNSFTSPTNQNNELKYAESLIHALYDKLYFPAPDWVKNTIIAMVLIIMPVPVLLMHYEFSLFKKNTFSSKYIMEMLVFVLVWTLLFLFMGGWNLLFVLIFPLILISPAIIILFLTHASQWTIFPAHYRRQDYELYIFNICNFSLGKWLNLLSYNFTVHHVEHHLFPGIPFHKLKTVSDFVHNEYQDYIFPTQVFDFTYLRDGVVNAMVKTQTVTIADQDVQVGGLFFNQLTPSAMRLSKTN